jgi:transcriptional regulator of acetoin/glycerol metabolism
LDEKENTIATVKKTIIDQETQETDANEITQTESQEIPKAITKISTLKEIEMEAIKSSVERNKWNMTITAEELGISRMTLYRKLEQYGLRSKN